MAKRKLKEDTGDEAEETPIRRSTRRKSAHKDSKPSAVALEKPIAQKNARRAKAQAKPRAEKQETEAKTNTKTKSTNQNRSQVAAPPAEVERNYWLLKAEPESRFENGVDVKFSIDDLAARTEPEPWDGIRNYAARNNLRAMKKGDLAFFYHSNCKEPGIAGTMEIVQEHSPDLSAHDPRTPYYDASSKPEDPKWSVVHVVFRSKFEKPITLKELRELGAAGKPLEHMQMLRQTRLSVSKVSAAEWAFLLGVAGVV